MSTSKRSSGPKEPNEGQSTQATKNSGSESTKLKGMERLIRTPRVLVCAGPGGVGKTSVAATLALRAAISGQRALVVTIDPARRLANSLGLEQLGNVESRIGGDLFARAGISPKGELWAMMLDVKRTSDDIIARHAKSPEQAQKIYENRFYQTASTVLAGSHEYLSMEKLYDLYEENRFDLIILDTPPTAHALDFLDAPNRVLDVLSNDSLRWLATPAMAAGKMGVRAVGMGSGYLIRQISKFTGIETLQALAEFLIAMQGMYDGFKERAAKVKRLLSSDETSFVLVTSPGSVDEALFFHQVLLENAMPVGAVVMNRMHPDWNAAAGGRLGSETLLTWFKPDLAQRLAQSISEHQVLAKSDREAAVKMASVMKPDALLRFIPILDRDVHDIAGLALMAQCLFDGEAIPAMAALPVIIAGKNQPDVSSFKDNETCKTSKDNQARPFGSSQLKNTLISSLIPFFVMLIGACSAHQTSTIVGDGPAEIVVDEIEIIGGDEESMALAAMNDEELFSEGSSFFASGELERAAKAFSLLVAAFPESELRAVAQYNAGFSWQRAGEYIKALDHYEPLLGIVDDRDWLDTIYRVSECLFQLEDYEEAARILGEILSLEGLPTNDRVRALVLQGVCLIEAGDEEEALHSLRSAVGRYEIEQRSGKERVDVFFPAKAQFHLGEIFRRRFERARLDPASTDYETLADDLEHKAQLLLSAQGHYLRTLRMGEPHWAAAAGHQIGYLYEELYRQIVSARMPVELEGTAERVAYMELLRKKVEILLEKALVAYERTLSTVERLGIDGQWRGRIEAGLERVKSLLLEDKNWLPMS